MTLPTARKICCLVIATCLAIAVLVGAFFHLSWPPLALMAWFSLTLFGKRTMLEATTRLVREMQGLWRNKNR
jgi:hypothetical protein